MNKKYFKPSFADYYNVILKKTIPTVFFYKIRYNFIGNPGIFTSLRASDPETQHEPVCYSAVRFQEIK